MPDVDGDGPGSEFAGNSDDEYETGTKNKAQQGFEAGVASIRFLAKKVRPPRTSSPPSSTDMLNSSASSGSSTPAGNGKMPSSFRFRKQTAEASPTNAANDPFSKVTDALAKRGEKLHSLANSSDQMAEDAGEMLSAAQALRIRQQKKTGFFG
jgi:hypothetical protein